MTKSLLRMCLLFLGWWPFGPLGTAVASPQQGATFTYICTASPYDKTKAMEVTATQENGSKVTGSVVAPGGRYYLATLKLSKGVEYNIEFKVGGVPVTVDREVFHPLGEPSKLRLRELYLDVPVRISSGPAGYVLLRAETETRVVNDGLRIPDVKVYTDGGEYKQVAKDPPVGVVFIYVKPGHKYKVQYNIGGKRYESEAMVAADDLLPNWKLKDMGSNAPCTYTVDEWGDCLGNKRSRAVHKGPPGCVQVNPPPITDTVCVDRPVPPIPVPSDPTPQACTSWSEPQWGACEGGMQHGVMQGIPDGCGTQDTTRSCGSAGGGTPFKRKGFTNPKPEEKDDCQVWRVMSITDTVPLTTAWNIGDRRRIVVDIDPIEFNGVISDASGAGAEAGFRDLIAVHDSVFLRLICEDDSVFQITDTEERNIHRTVHSTFGAKFSWYVKALKRPDGGRTKFTLIYYTIDCSTGQMVSIDEKPYNIPVAFDPGGWWDMILTWLEKNVIRITGLLAMITGLIAAIKKFGWFKGKGAKEESPA